MKPAINHYGQFCKPNLQSQLQSLGLDKHYFKAQGNYVYYRRDGTAIKVLDFLGGFGSLLFGHNNKQLSETLVTALQQQVPFAAQGSDRSEAGDLAALLNGVLKERLGEDYLTLLSNSGTEAMEVCLKHCLYTHYHRKKRKIEQVKSSLKKILSQLGAGATIDNGLRLQLERLFPGKTWPADLASICQFLRTENEKVLGRPAVLMALENAFHGKTLGSLGLTFNPAYKKELNDSVMNSLHIKAGHESLISAILDNSDQLYSLVLENHTLRVQTDQFSLIAGFVIEPIQGEGGMKVINRDFLRRAAQTCKLYDIPLVFDEIQTGMGRTGTFLYAEQTGITPDYITLSKSLGGGLVKIGATLIPRRIYGDGFDKIHSSTFAEDALSALVATQCVKMLVENDFILSNVKERAIQLKAGIEKIAMTYPGIIREIRGEGLMLGIEFEAPVHSGSNCYRLLNDQELLGYVICGYLLNEFDIRTLPCLSQKRVIRIEPSGYTSKEESDLFLEAIKRLCEVLYKENMFELCKYITGRPQTNTNQPVANYRNPPFAADVDFCDRKVAFIGHFVNASDLVDWDRSFELFTGEEIEKLLEAVYPMISPFVSDRKTVRSVAGQKVQFDLLGYVITSKIIGRHMRQKNLEPIIEKIYDCLNMAEENGCSVVGFGGFTSIITGNCTHITMESSHYTTGNAFTTAMGLEAMLSETQKMKIDLQQSTFAAVGAGGNIASVYCEFMAQRCKKVILVGAEGRLENINRLALRIFHSALVQLGSPDEQVGGIAVAFKDVLHPALRHNISDSITGNKDLFDLLKEQMGDEFPIVVTDNIHTVKTANLILSATNSPDPVLFPGMLGDEPTVICDIAVPYDVDASVYEMENVKVIKGGIVRVPNNEDFKIPGVLLPKGTTYACMSETMLLGLEGINAHYSYGDISLAQVNDVFQMAKKHGFRLDQPKLERSF